VTQISDLCGFLSAWHASVGSDLPHKDEVNIQAHNGINRMSDNFMARDTHVVSGLSGRSANPFQYILSSRQSIVNDAPLPDKVKLGLFKNVRPNIVQSIRAFRVLDLAREAERLGQHFLYACCSEAQTKAEVLSTITASFLLPKQESKNYDALYDSLTDLIRKAGPQPGFVIVLEGLPATQKFDKEARETLLDIFREAAEFWAKSEVDFRVFFSFALSSAAPAYS